MPVFMIKVILVTLAVSWFSVFSQALTESFFVGKPTRAVELVCKNAYCRIAVNQINGIVDAKAHCLNLNALQLKLNLVHNGLVLVVNVEILATEKSKQTSVFADCVQLRRGKILGDTFKRMGFIEIKLYNSDLPIKIKKKPIRADELKFVDFFSNNSQIKYALVRRKKIPCQKCDVFRAGFITNDSFRVEFIDGDTFDLF